MSGRGGRRLLRLGLAVVLLVQLAPERALASVGACSVTISPPAVQPADAPVFDFALHNTTGPAIQWIQIERPNANYHVDAAGLSGWDASIDETGMLLTNGSLPTGGDFEFELAARTGLDQSPASNWTVRVSDDASGLDATVCGGDVSTAVTGHFPSAGEGQRISGITVDTTATSATVRWYSDVPTGSEVLYGRTADYGSVTAYNSTYTTTHKVVLPGLAPGAGYHMQVAGIDASGNPSYSGDNTFSTNSGPSSSGSEDQPVATLTPSSHLGVTDVVPPTVTVATKLSGPYRVAPSINGVARDNVAVAKVEYSTDGGKTWLGVIGSKVVKGGGVAFAFTPILVDDGNYSLIVRATDSSGNQAVTAAQMLVVDRLPPAFGGELVALGSQSLTPDASGCWPVVADVDHRLTLGAVGGPVSVTVLATRQGMTRAGQAFILRRNDQTGLWTGAVHFHQPGVYTLVVQAVDGAGNRVSSHLAGVTVSPAAMVVDGQGAAVKGAKVSLYYRQSQTDRWVVWDGSGLGEANPQTTYADGRFRFLVPPGTYYLRAEAPGHASVVTQQFTTVGSTPLVPVLKLGQRPTLRLGSWRLELPWPTWSRTSISPSEPTTAVAAALVGKPWPSLSLPATDGGTITSVGLLGRLTVVTVLSSWDPVTNEQLPELAKLAHSNASLAVVPLVMGERIGRVRMFVERGDYGLRAAVDEAASVSEVLGVPAEPTHYLIDRGGVVRSVLVGVKTSEQLEAALTAL